MESTDGPLWLTASQPHCGVVGMVNCLRQEPGGNRIRYDLLHFYETRTLDSAKHDKKHEDTYNMSKMYLSYVQKLQHCSSVLLQI